MLNVGWLTAPAGVWRNGDDLEQPKRIPVPAYVIETDEERILVDTGLHPAVAEDPAAHYGAADALAVFSFEQDASVADQLDLSTVTRVVLTHLHFDHAGGLALLPSLGSGRPAAAGVGGGPRRGRGIRRNFFLPADYASVDDQVVLVDGDHDLLGDGSIQLLLTPGHTAGHQSVQVGERLVLGGDVVHYASGLDDQRFPAFADDFAAQAASAERLRELRDDGVVVRPGHDPDVLKPGPVPV